MAEGTRETGGFPTYLRSGPDLRLNKWLGKALRKQRSKPLATAARNANATSMELKEIEGGQFHLNLGRLREIIRLGYETALEDLLHTCFDAHPKVFDSSRPFDRDYHYSVSLDKREGKKPTPFFIGGKPDSYLWAVPMRKLKEQPLLTELIELAPARKRISSGVTPDNLHAGVEVLHVIHGRIEVHIASRGEAPYGRRLRAGDSIHFHSKYPHKIENLENGTSALLLVVRLPDNTPTPPIPQL